MTMQSLLEGALKLSVADRRTFAETLLQSLTPAESESPSYRSAASATAQTRPDEDKAGEAPPEVFTFRLPRKGARARAYLYYPRMVVLKGSTIATSVAEAMPEKYKLLRNYLVETGVIAKRDGQLVFTTNKSFTNPSVAACIVEGGSRSGHESWRDAAGQTLHQLGFSRW